MRFEFATATRIIFGPGSARDIQQYAGAMGRNALICLGLPISQAQSLLKNLSSSKYSFTILPVFAEPTTISISEGISLAKQHQCDHVIGIGGGSAIDTCKAIAALMTNPGELTDYLEVIGKGKPLTNQPLPIIAIPTTAGTGAEVTRNAVIGSPEHGVKVSLRSPLLLPGLSIVDPELTYLLPPQITATTGLDALTQLIEPYISTRANPLIDPICREGMHRSARSLRRAYENGMHKEARFDLSLSSLFSGIALANTGLGAVHGLAGPLGGMCQAPHGSICARLLPVVLDANLHALQKRAPNSPSIERFQDISKILTGHPDARPDEGISWIMDICNEFKIPSLSAMGVKQSDFPLIIQAATKSSSIKANPIELTIDEMYSILTKAM